MPQVYPAARRRRYPRGDEILVLVIAARKRAVAERSAVHAAYAAHAVADGRSVAGRGHFHFDPAQPVYVHFRPGVRVGRGQRRFRSAHRLAEKARHIAGGNAERAVQKSRRRREIIAYPAFTHRQKVRHIVRYAFGYGSEIQIVSIRRAHMLCHRVYKRYIVRRSRHARLVRIPAALADDGAQSVHGHFGDSRIVIVHERAI